MTTNSNSTSDTSNTSEILPSFTRVSEILGLYQDFSKIDPQVLARKCAIGTEVHKAIECFYKEEFYPISTSARPYYNSFKSALSTELSTYKPLVLEKRYYSKKMKITGQVDLIAATPEGTILMDFKTSYSQNVPIWSLQMALYSILIAENGLKDIKQAKILQLKKGPKFSLISIDLKKPLLDLAKSAVKLYRFLQ